MRPGQHFGVALIGYLLYQHHHCGVTQPLLREQLLELGLDISTGQIHHLLTDNTEAFHQEKAELLSAGLALSSYVGVDDTAARHEGRNGVCTVISNDLFAFFQSTDSKGRAELPGVLRTTRARPMRSTRSPPDLLARARACRRTAGRN